MDDDLNFFGGGIKYIDVSVLQRNNKKCWTVISGLEYKDSEKKVLLQKLKKMLSCNGNIDENGNVKPQGPDWATSSKAISAKIFKTYRDRVAKDDKYMKLRKRWREYENNNIQES